MSTTLKEAGNDHYLKEIIESFKSRGFSSERLVPGISTNSLISLINQNFESPSLSHYLDLQAAWFRDHAWNMQEESKRALRERGEYYDGKTLEPIEPTEVIFNWITSSLQREHHAEYVKSYILGKPVSEKNVEWVYNFLEKTADEVDMSEFYSVVSQRG